MNPDVLVFLGNKIIEKMSVEKTVFNKDFNKELLIEKFKDTIYGDLNMRIDKITEGHVEASMPLSPKIVRPGEGVLYGGLILSLVETVAGIGSLSLLDLDKYDIRGVQINTNHVRGLAAGRVYVISDILHHGRRTHVWNVDVKNEEGKLISTGRVMNMIVEKAS